MKKFIILSLIAFLGIALNAQDLKIGDSGYGILNKRSSSDAASGTTAKAWEFQVYRSGGYLYRYDFIIELDSAGDGTNFTVELEGSYDGTEYYDITSVTWGVTSTDTTIRLNNFAQTNSIATTNAAHNEIRRGTATTAAYVITQDTAGLDVGFTDSIYVAQQVVTFADTVAIGAQTITSTETVTSGAVGWKYIQVKLTGAGAGAGCTLDYISVAILKEE